MKFLANRVYKLNESKQKPSNAVGAFLEIHILGLIASISEVINDAKDEYSMIEKERSVKAVEEMVKVANSYTRVARPQVISFVLPRIYSFRLFNRCVLVYNQL